MKQIESRLKSTDGQELYLSSWYPEGQIKGTVCLIHGASEHCGRYESVVKEFTNEGFVVFAIDLRGHGKTQGKRGHIESYQQTLLDIDTLVKKAYNDNPALPIILYGHSMGGGICLNYLAKYNNNFVSGAIISAPFIHLYKKPNILAIMALRTLAKISPTFKISNGIAVSDLCSNIEEIDKANKDPMFSDKLSALSIVETYDAGNYIYKHPEKINVPFVIMHGLDDKVTSSGASKYFVEGSKMGEFIPYKGFKHEIHHEVSSESVLKDMTKWIACVLVKNENTKNNHTNNIKNNRSCFFERDVSKESILENKRKLYNTCLFDRDLNTSANSKNHEVGNTTYMNHNI